MCHVNKKFVCHIELRMSLNKGYHNNKRMSHFDTKYSLYYNNKKLCVILTLKIEGDIHMDSKI